MGKKGNKLLLIEDVDSLGRKGEIITVKPGYARNYLLPQHFAIIASPQTIRMQARLQEERRQLAITDKREAEAIAQSIQDQTVTTIVKVDREGHMYGSVSAIDVMHLLQEHLQVAIEKRNVVLAHPLKELGEHKIALKLKEGVNPTFTLKIVSEMAQAEVKDKS